MMAGSSLIGAVVRPHPSGGYTLAVPAGGGARNYVGNWPTAWAAARWLAKAAEKAREGKR